jgi:hypothetical protein
MFVAMFLSTYAGLCASVILFEPIYRFALNFNMVRSGILAVVTVNISYRFVIIVNFISIKFMLINWPSQQPDGQLQKQHNIQT